jgi:hypothetical protein
MVQKPRSNPEEIPRQLKQPKESIDKQLMAGHLIKDKYKKAKGARQGALAQCRQAYALCRPFKRCYGRSYGKGILFLDRLVSSGPDWPIRAGAFILAKKTR